MNIGISYIAFPRIFYIIMPSSTETFMVVDGNEYKLASGKWITALLIRFDKQSYHQMWPVCAQTNLVNVNSFFFTFISYWKKGYFDNFVFHNQALPYLLYDVFYVLLYNYLEYFGSTELNIKTVASQVMATRWVYF